MLQIVVPARELWDEINERFVNVKETKLTLEHSLVSISKWEAKWHKSFFSDDKTQEMMIDYIRDMTLTQNVDPNIYNYLSDENLMDIRKYMEDSRTATKFFNEQKSSRREVITSELVYFWMVHWGIPFECQKWHINRLLTLIRICGIKNQPQKKMSQREVLGQYASINAARKKKYNTRG